MRRTQVYLTEEQDRHLERLAAQMDKSQSEIIREAIDEYAKRRAEDTRIALLRSGWNLFSGEDLQEVETVRAELENRVDDEDG